MAVDHLVKGFMPISLLHDEFVEFDAAFRMLLEQGAQAECVDHLKPSAGGNGEILGFGDASLLGETGLLLGDQIGGGRLIGYGGAPGGQGGRLTIVEGLDHPERLVLAEGELIDGAEAPFAEFLADAHARLLSDFFQGQAFSQRRAGALV